MLKSWLTHAVASLRNLLGEAAVTLHTHLLSVEQKASRRGNGGGGMWVILRGSLNAGMGVQVEGSSGGECVLESLRSPSKAPSTTVFPEDSADA
ncbi:MAG: hypothetical protein B6U76_02145 [Desulfurococcales archaeon ex4484_217_2]|nr:MAG: hypothetical protein B6U76_02145 [Desulfurococcales archaeon ex4484_217_2]